MFHVTIRALSGHAPFRGAVGAAVWAAVLAERERPSVDLFAACLMPDHLHVLVKPGARSVIQWLGTFKSYTTAVARNRGGRHFLWQPSFYDRRIRDVAEFEAVVSYIVGNPAAAGLVDGEDEWPWVYAKGE
ncbi:MAG: transposase [Dehalococcoidia bacterium]